MWIASVCDPYPSVERRCRITRRCVETPVQRPFPVVIQTKSDLVLRDLDLLERLPDVEVGVTIAGFQVPETMTLIRTLTDRFLTSPCREILPRVAVRHHTSICIPMVCR